MKSCASNIDYETFPASHPKYYSETSSLNYMKENVLINSLENTNLSTPIVPLVVFLLLLFT